MSDGTKQVGLDTVAGGAAAELFERELSAVLENIQDANTNWKTPRKVILEVTIHANDKREFGHTTLKCSSKLAAVSPVSTPIFFGLDKGKAVAFEHESTTEPLFTDDANVKNIATKRA